MDINELGEDLNSVYGFASISGWTGSELLLGAVMFEQICKALAFGRDLPLSRDAFQAA